MKNIKFYLCLFICLVSSFDLVAQRATLDGISSAYLRKSGIIQGRDAIAGYYFLTQKIETKAPGKRSKNSEKTYLLTLMDQDLNIIGSKEFISGKGLTILDAVYNGTFLAVKMVNFDAREKWLEVMDKQGVTVQRIELSFGIYDNPVIAASLSVIDWQELVPVNGGFLHINFWSKNDKPLGRSRYDIQFIATNDDSEKWTTSTPIKSKDAEGANFITANDSIAVFCIWKRSNIVAQNMHTEIWAYNLKTGERTFVVRPTDEETEVRWYTGRFIDDEIVLVGTNAGEDGRLLTEKAQGINSLRITTSGELISKQAFNLATSLERVWPATKYGKLSEKVNFYLHEFEIADDGHIVLAAEFYKIYDAAAVARDGILFHITPDFQLNDVTIIEKIVYPKKKKRVFASAKGYSSSKKERLAQMAATSSQFDFTLLAQSGDVITAGYFSTRREIGEYKRLSLHASSLLDGEVFKEVIVFDENSDSVIVLPAKSGYVMVIEYDEDAKSIDIHLERLRL